jgi:hypothetical protein
MGPPLQDFLCAFEPSDWVFPVATAQPILGDYTIDMHESDNEFSEATQGLLATVKAIGPFDQFI